jgi:hypothetical protein
MLRELPRVVEAVDNDSGEIAEQPGAAPAPVLRSRLERARK